MIASNNSNNTKEHVMWPAWLNNNNNKVVEKNIFQTKCYFWYC